MGLHKLFVRSAFLTFPSAWNGVELEGGEKVKENLNLQKILKSIPIPNKKNIKTKGGCDERQKWKRWKSWEKNPLCAVWIKNNKKNLKPWKKGREWEKKSKVNLIL